MTSDLRLSRTIKATTQHFGFILKEAKQPEIKPCTIREWAPQYLVVLSAALASCHLQNLCVANICDDWVLWSARNPAVTAPGEIFLRISNCVSVSSKGKYLPSSGPGNHTLQKIGYEMQK